MSDMVKRAETDIRLSTPLRAEITAEIDGVEGKKQDRFVMMQRPAPDGQAAIQIRLELEKAGQRFLVLSSSESYVAAGGSVKKAAPDSPIDGTSWTVEDLLPFAAERCAGMRIADQRPDQVTFTCEPKREAGSQYSLVVYKYDLEKSVPVQVLYYKETLSNLVKMRRDEEFVQVAGKWRPTRVLMQDFKLRARDELAIKWSVAAGLDGAQFDPKTLAATP